MAETKEVTPRTNGPALSVWEPFAGLETWARQMADRRMPWGGLFSAFDDIDFTPLADIEETDEAWTIEVELAGVKKGDIEVETHGRTVAISGERKEKERTGVLRERRRVTGSFRYEVTLPGEFDIDAINADLTDGVLMITLPKAEHEAPKKVNIT